MKDRKAEVNGRPWDDEMCDKRHRDYEEGQNIKRDLTIQPVLLIAEQKATELVTTFIYSVRQRPRLVGKIC